MCSLLVRLTTARKLSKRSTRLSRGERLQQAIERAREMIGKPREIARSLARITSLPGTLHNLASPSKLVGRIGCEYFLLDPDEVLALPAEGVYFGCTSSALRWSPHR